MSKDTPKPNTTNSELDEILHEFSVAQSLSETQLSDKLKRGVITADEFDERLVDSYREHKAEAKARLEALIASKVEEARIDLLDISQKALNLCDSINDCHGCMGLNKDLRKSYKTLSTRLKALQPKEGDR